MLSVLFHYAHKYFKPLFARGYIKYAAKRRYTLLHIFKAYPSGADAFAALAVILNAKGTKCRMITHIDVDSIAF